MSLVYLCFVDSVPVTIAFSPSCPFISDCVLELACFFLSEQMSISHIPSFFRFPTLWAVGLRLQLLEPHKYPFLFKALYGLLMLLPQSSAFTSLRARLNSVSTMGVLQLIPKEYAFRFSFLSWLWNAFSMLS